MRGDRVPSDSRAVRIASQIPLAAFCLGCLVAGLLGNWGMLAFPIGFGFLYALDRRYSLDWLTSGAHAKYVPMRTIWMLHACLTAVLAGSIYLWIKSGNLGLFMSLVPAYFAFIFYIVTRIFVNQVDVNE